MLRRLATLLLALSVTLAGLMAKPHAAACCVVRQAPGHDCCKAPAQLRTSDCCRGNPQLTDRAVHSQQQPPPALPLALAAPALDAAAQAAEWVATVPLQRGLAPPGSLIAQHTSLLL